MVTELKFIHVGMGNMVCANRVIAMVRPDSQAGRRHLEQAKKKKCYIDARFGHALKTLLILEDGSVMGSAITAKTLVKRANAKPESNVVFEYDSVDRASENEVEVIEEEEQPDDT